MWSIHSCCNVLFPVIKKCGIIMSFHAAERLSPAMERLYLIITMICITVVSKKYNDYYIIPKKNSILEMKWPIPLWNYSINCNLEHLSTSGPWAFKKIWNWNLKISKKLAGIFSLPQSSSHNEWIFSLL